MKLCAACNQTLPRGNFSKKQWQMKQKRRCKECIANNRETNLEAREAADDAPPSGIAGEGETASCFTDKDIFKQHAPNEECPICLQTLPLSAGEQKYQPCCGKILCYGCIYAAYTADDRRLCPFCRAPEARSEGEIVKRMKERAEANDAIAIHTLGCRYRNGEYGLPQDYGKAMELWHRAGELGYAASYFNIAQAYRNGEGVERDMKKAKHYYELAAMGGDVISRHNLGATEWNAGNMDKAVKHFMISAGTGDDDSLTKIRDCFMNGYATKDDFEKTLRAHKDAKDEMKSDQRDEAAAAPTGNG